VIDATATHNGDGAHHRNTLSRLRSLMILAQLMMESSTEEQIIQLAVGAARSLAPCSQARAELDAELMPSGDVMLQGLGVLDVAAPATAAGGPGAWAYPLHSGQGHVGWLIAECASEPDEEEHFLLRSLAQHAGAAIVNRRLHEQERAAATEAARINAQLQQTLDALQGSMAIHARLTEVAVSGQGRQGLAEAVHELTGLPVAVEDGVGNLRAWAGPDRPDPYPKPGHDERERLLRRALREGRPLRVEDRWIGVIQPQQDVTGALVLIDPDGEATPQQLTALEHGMTVLAMELARLRSLAESELRVRRDLVEELLAGTDEESALRRAQALRYDLERPHRVVVVEGHDRDHDDEAFLHGVRRAARDLPVGSLLIRRGSHVVVLADHDASWEQFRAHILTEVRDGRCRMGIGNLAATIAGIPESLRQAEIALRVQHTSGGADQVTSYETLGVYQLLAEIGDPTATEAFGRRWLQPLLDYDEQRSADLVLTLSRYLDCGGNYDATAGALFIHRSTLKYRLHRIREVSGYDLTDPDTRFNLQLACRAWGTLNALRGLTGSATQD
jgi:DNA-binding PucR family transcriptional regulator